jgi:transmembrane sensor
LSVTQNEKPGREALAQASVWLARLRADDCTPEDQRNFAAWLAEASTHRSAFETVTAAFDMAGAAATDHWPRTPPMEDEGELEPVSAVPASRRSFLLGAGIVAVGGGAIGWQAAFAGAIETRVREPWLRERRLNLQRGRISVQVPENAQAFRIDADAHVIRGNAMDADVRWENGGLTVSVVRGTLSVSNKGGAPVRLSEGQRLLPSGMIDLPTMGALTAWRDGQLVFVDTPLADACAELNRYDRTRLIPAPDAAGLRISGTYRMGSNVQFARALEQLLPLHRQVVDGVVRLERIDVRQ